jgi:hypothetical protein
VIESDVVAQRMLAIRLTLYRSSTMKEIHGQIKFENQAISNLLICERLIILLQNAVIYLCRALKIAVESGGQGTSS